MGPLWRPVHGCTRFLEFYRASVGRSVARSAGRLVGCLAGWSIGRLVGWLVGRPLGRSVGRSAGRPVVRSASRPVDRSDAYLTRLRAACAHVNDNFDVAGLNRELPSRVQKLLELKGDKLRK